MTLAEEDLAAQFGGMWGPDINAAVVGTRLDVAVPTILRFFGAPTPRRRWPRPRRDCCAAWSLFGESLPLVPGATELVAALRAEGVPQALVSSSFRVLVDAALAQASSPSRCRWPATRWCTGSRTRSRTSRRRAGWAPAPSGASSSRTRPRAWPRERRRCAWWPCQACRVAFAPAPRRLVTGSLAPVGVDPLQALV